MTDADAVYPDAQDYESQADFLEAQVHWLAGKLQACEQQIKALEDGRRDWKTLSESLSEQHSRVLEEKRELIEDKRRLTAKVEALRQALMECITSPHSACYKVGPERRLEAINAVVAATLK